MPRALKPKTLTRITPAREGSTYQLELEDEAGKRVLFELTSEQTLRLADELDDLLVGSRLQARRLDQLHPFAAPGLRPAGRNLGVCVRDRELGPGAASDSGCVRLGAAAAQPAMATAAVRRMLWIAATRRLMASGFGLIPAPSSPHRGRRRSGIAVRR